MFYVLSGFLVTGILSREVEKHNDFPVPLAPWGIYLPVAFSGYSPVTLFLACYAVFASKHAALSWWVLFLPLSNWLGGPYITWHIKTLHIEETYYIFIGICSGIFWRTLKSIMWTMLLLAPLGRVFIFGFFERHSG